MTMKPLEEVEATKSVKEQALEKLAKLEGIIKGLQTKVDDLQEALDEEKDKVAKAIINQCWWDGKSCGRYSEISGFQDADGRCLSCPRLDKDRILCIFIQLFGAKFDYENDKAIEETSKETEEDAWEEIKDKIGDLLEKVEVE